MNQFSYKHTMTVSGPDGNLEFVAHFDRRKVSMLELLEKFDIEGIAPVDGDSLSFKVEVVK